MIQITFTGNTLAEALSNAKAMAEEFLKEDTASKKSTLGLRDDLDDAKVIEDEKPKRGRSTQAPRAIDAKAKDVTKDKAPEITAEKIRERVQAITDAAQKRGDEMPEAIAYVKKLFAKFEMKKVSDLPAEKYADFMTVSEAFLQAGAE